MQSNRILELLASVGAIRHGHFELSSGLHSDTYVQCALILQYPKLAEQLGAALAAKFSGIDIACVVSPALGGVIVGHEVARGLSFANPDKSISASAVPFNSAKTIAANGVPAIFVERDASGAMTLRRGFSIEQGAPVLVVEDVWTTGGSTFEAIKVVEESGGRVVAAGALIDRSQGRLEFPVHSESLVQLNIQSHQPADCPLCKSGSPAIKPGSRFLRASR